MYKEVISQIPEDVQLVAVTKLRSNEQILNLYNQGQRIFGENRVFELEEKQKILPIDIEWHMIGHLQRNKVKYIAPFVSMIHSVDTLKLIKEVNKQAKKNERTIRILLQIKIGQEEAKSGFDFNELETALAGYFLTDLENIEVCGVMGMASFVSDEHQISQEFSQLKSYFDKLKSDYFVDNPEFKEISMGMSGDFKIAIECGSTIVRIGSLLFS